MNLKNLLKNDNAVSISISFILMLSITVLVFSAIVLSFYTLSQQSEKTAMRESYEILGSELAVKITTVDTLVNITNSYGGTTKIEYEFSIPTSIAGEGYSINITKNQIILESDNGARAFVPFNISANLTENKIHSGIGNYKLYYDAATNSINIK